jgi:hypothetical protein
MREYDDSGAGADAAPELISCESALWLRVQRGDERAFEALYRRHAAMIHRVCWKLFSRRLVSGDIAARCEDAVSETFLHAWRRRAEIRVDASLAPWLVVTATHTCENLVRGDRRRQLLVHHVAAQADVRHDDEPDTAVLRDGKCPTTDDRAAVAGGWSPRSWPPPAGGVMSGSRPLLVGAAVAAPHDHR